MSLVSPMMSRSPDSPSLLGRTLCPRFVRGRVSLFGTWARLGDLSPDDARDRDPAARLSLSTTLSALGAFNVVLLEHAEAFVFPADRAGLPVVLQISENCVHYHGELAPLASATLCLARGRTSGLRTARPCRLRPARLVDEAVELGVPSVMFDGSMPDYPTNLSETALLRR